MLLVHVKSNKVLIGLTSAILLCLSACSQTQSKVNGLEHNENSQQTYQQTVDREQALAKHDVWHAAKLKGASFRAIGQEPAWFIEFYPEEGIYLSQDYGVKIQTFEYLAPVTDKIKARSIFSLENQGEVIIEGIPCTDIMSGEQFEATVTVMFENKRLFGCGKSLY